MGCFRLCYRYDEKQKFFKGNDDYIQSSFIHIKLQEFIHEIFNDLEESNDYLCLEEFALNEQDMIEVREHISNTKRIIRRKPFRDNNKYKCGRDIDDNFENINFNLKKFSEELKSLYHYSNNELISNIIINDEENVYNMQFYKVNLDLQIPNYKTQKLKKKDYDNEDNIDNIILYYCNAKITKFMKNQFEEPRFINLPVFLTTEEGDKITKFGTFEKYILAGNYICKVFDYISQCAQDHIGECYGDYKLIGNRYNNIFPLLEINSTINISWNDDLFDENIQIIKMKKKRERKVEIEIENNVKKIKNKNLIKIDDFYFLVLNKNITKDRPIVNIYSSTNENFSENNNNFSVYLSNSDLGCFRLCLRYYPFHKQFDKYEKGIDYIQSSFIHIKLQEYIHQIFNNLEPSIDYFCSYKKTESHAYINATKLYEHIHEKRRVIKKTPFIENNKYVCGEDYKQSSYYEVNKNLNNFSELLKSLYDYNYSNNEPISKVNINDSDNVYDLEFYKVKLKLKDQEQEYIDDIILYYCNAKITKFMENKFEEPIYINLPIFLTTEEGEKITKFGTFEKYILAGNYICKVFDYSTQCLREQPGKCYGEYKLIGDRYNNIFPLLEIREQLELQEAIRYKQDVREEEKYNDKQFKDFLEREAREEEEKQFAINLQIENDKKLARDRDRDRDRYRQLQQSAKSQQDVREEEYYNYKKLLAREEKYNDEQLKEFLRREEKEEKDRREKLLVNDQKVAKELQEEDRDRQLQIINDERIARELARELAGGVIQIINDRCDSNIKNIRDSNCNQKIQKIQNVYNVRKQLIEDTERFFNKKINKKLNS